MQTGLIQNAHDDLVTDAAYDFYGLHLATCSLDQRIKVWKLDESTGEWISKDAWKAHDATVSKLSWAHPEFGSILASSSFDRTVKIWEQTYSEPESQANGARSQNTSRWIERAVLVDAKGTVRSVEFSPHHFGLKLATISSDNFLRVYECLEQPVLTTWQLTEEIDILSLPSVQGPLSNAIALTTPTQTFTSLENTPPLPAHSLQSQQSLTRLGSGPHREADGGWCLSWCKERYWGEILAASVGTTGTVHIIQLLPSRRPLILLTLDPYPSPTTTSFDEAGNGLSQTRYAITSISWAPSCGRSTHLIATGSRDGHVKIWRVKRPDGSGEESNEGKWFGRVAADFDDHK
ncbi:WD40 repeat-like protein [Thelephora ganbajun]|uniref:WD40 repeat-like protein n=1 Tax=Thelephora ganbajun TaxID=370292 RepID=A0ACB6ZTB1_THEGA|nr:WD40 repeat-like protein [Thelephora ganbajun]